MHLSHSNRSKANSRRAGENEDCLAVDEKECSGVEFGEITCVMYIYIIYIYIFNIIYIIYIYDFLTCIKLHELLGFCDF